MIRGTVDGVKEQAVYAENCPLHVMAETDEGERKYTPAAKQCGIIV